LETLAESGRVVPEVADPAVRELVISSYRLIYQLDAEDVHILGVIHGARDLQALWHGQQGDRRRRTVP
jgi:plasmid stabilization system protein ParE